MIKIVKCLRLHSSFELTSEPVSVPRMVAEDTKLLDLRQNTYLQHRRQHQLHSPLPLKSQRGNEEMGQVDAAHTVGLCHKGSPNLGDTNFVKEDTTNLTYLCHRTENEPFLFFQKMTHHYPMLFTIHTHILEKFIMYKSQQETSRNIEDCS